MHENRQEHLLQQLLHYHAAHSEVDFAKPSVLFQNSKPFLKFIQNRHRHGWQLQSIFANSSFFRTSTVDPTIAPRINPRIAGATQITAAPPKSN